MTKKRRVIETLKSLLIVALTCSALWLVSDSRLVGFLPDMIGSPAGGQSGTVNPGTRTQAVMPLRMAVISEEGCYAAQYGSGEVESLFNRTASLLNEALSGAQLPREVSAQEWEQALLSAPGIYFDFQGDVPLQVLCGWLSGKENASLTDSACRLLLSAGSDGDVLLYYTGHDAEKFFVCRTQLVNISNLRSAAEGVAANGAVFACGAADYAQLAADTLIGAQTLQPKVFAAENPLLEEQEDRLARLLNILSFPEGITTIYDTSEGRRIRSGNDTLTISPDGLLTLHSSADDARYPVVPAEGNGALFAAVEGARALVAEITQPWRGEAGLYLQQVRQLDADRWQVRFGYVLDDTPVQVGQNGYAASVLVERGCITEFEIQLRSYVSTEQTVLVLPEKQAAAALTQMNGQGGRLQLCYLDRGDNVYAVWIAQ